MSKKSVILLEDISSSQAETESTVGAAVSPPPFDAPEENLAGERGEESPVRGPEGPIEEGCFCQTEVAKEADLEDKDVAVLGGVNEVGISGYES